MIIYKMDEKYFLVYKCDNIKLHHRLYELLQDPGVSVCFSAFKNDTHYFIWSPIDKVDQYLDLIKKEGIEYKIHKLSYLAEKRYRSYEDYIDKELK